MTRIRVSMLGADHHSIHNNQSAAHDIVNEKSKNMMSSEP
jgi:hypothetical protein